VRKVKRLLAGDAVIPNVNVRPVLSRRESKAYPPSKGFA